MIKQRQQGTTRLNTLRRDDLESRFPGLLETILKAADGPAMAAARAAAGPARSVREPAHAAAARRR